MNPWLDFLVTLLVRFFSGFVIGCIVSYAFGFRIVMRAISEDGFPVERFLVWGTVGGILCMFTSPRDSWPWSKG